MWLSFCLYAAEVSVAVMCCIAVIVKMSNTLTNEEYANMNFVYDSCNGNGRAAVVEYC